MESGSQRLTRRETEPQVSDVAWSKDGKYLASASDDKTIKLWSVLRAHEHQVDTLINTFEGHTSYVMCVDFNHKGNILVSGSHDETVRTLTQYRA
jgi:COMPASS component SWD3